MNARAVSVPVTLDLYGISVHTVFCYDPADPFAVVVEVPDQVDPRTCAPVTWLFARDLLAEGMSAPAGVGDVRVVPTSADTVAVSLISDDGSCVLAVPRDRLSYFLRRTYGLVPRGAEQVDVDGWIRRMLDGAR